MHSIERSSVASVRKTLAVLGAVVAEVDEQLRYVWIDNPHPDFDAKHVIGKRDDQLIAEPDAKQIMELKRETFARQSPMSQVLSFRRTDGVRHYSLFAYPICGTSGNVEAILTVAFDMLPSVGKRD